MSGSGAEGTIIRGQVSGVGGERVWIRLASGKKLEIPLVRWEPGPGRRPVPLEAVECVVSADGRQILRARPVGWTPATAAPAPAARGRTMPEAPHFLHPYNFVRTPGDPVRAEAPPPDVRLLGREPPPPLDRYVGLTGTARLRIRTGSPVFVSDSYGVEEDGAVRGHRTYRFHRDADGRPAIPASTLRGAVRSVFEAVTGSCWEHVADERRLSRRETPEVAKRLVPARLVREGKDWYAELLTGTTPYREHGPSSRDTLYAAWVLAYRDSAAPGPDDGTYARRPCTEIEPGLRHGQPCHARLRRCAYEKKGKVLFHFWHALRVGSEAFVGEAGPGEERFEGFYFCTGRNIERKHDERFFFREGRPERIPVPDPEDRVQRYRDLLDDYRQRHLGRVEEPEPRKAGGKEAGARSDRRRSTGCDSGPLVPSRFLGEPVPSLEGCHGQLVYVLPEGGARPTGVESLAPVAVPRLLYNDPMSKRRPAGEAVRPCSEVAEQARGEVSLCPACRVFGWVARRKTPDGVPAAIRSRVRFGDARFAPDALVEAPTTLAILSSPKPTTVRFYLMPRDGKLTPEPDESRIHWDRTRMQMRGRKFYRRHRAVAAAAESRSNQNRTLRDHLPAGAEATFEVRFENLAEVEMGALLWSLELPAQWRHRLGFARPLGWGDVEITLEELVLHDADRYAAEPVSDPGPPAMERADAARARFVRATAARFGAPFDTLRHVQDLEAMLGPAPEMAVGYPPGGYEWFGDNRGRRGKGVWLGLAAEDPGLPVDPLETMARR